MPPQQYVLLLNLHEFYPLWIELEQIEGKQDKMKKIIKIIGNRMYTIFTYNYINLEI